jgi:hypothetical protein
MSAIKCNDYTISIRLGSDNSTKKLYAFLARDMVCDCVRHASQLGFIVESFLRSNSY